MMLFLALAVPTTGSEVPISTLAQLYNGEVVISSPDHTGSYMMRVDGAPGQGTPGICKGAEFCCTAERDGRPWYLLDGDSSSPAHDAWFDALSAAAGFEEAVRGVVACAGSCRRRLSGSPMRSLASWRSKKSDALIQRIAGYSISSPVPGRSHHLSKD
eukprot:5739468-Prymnesium_polylepis.1